MAYSELPYNGNLPPGVSDNDSYFNDADPGEDVICVICGFTLDSNGDCNCNPEEPD